MVEDKMVLYLMTLLRKTSIALDDTIWHVEGVHDGLLPPSIEARLRLVEEADRILGMLADMGIVIGDVREGNITSGTWNRPVGPAIPTVQDEPLPF